MEEAMRHADPIAQAAIDRLEAENAELRAKVAAVEALADSLTWVKPGSACENAAACCGSAAACGAMYPSASVVGAGTIRAALEAKP